MPYHYRLLRCYLAQIVKLGNLDAAERSEAALGLLIFRDPRSADLRFSREIRGSREPTCYRYWFEQREKDRFSPILARIWLIMKSLEPR